MFDRPKLFIAVLAAATLITGSSTVIRTFRTQARTDLTVFLRAAEAVENHEDIYRVRNSRGWNYVYFPFLAVTLIPLTKIPLSAAAAVWYLISALCFFVMCRMVIKMFPRARDGLSAVCTAGILCLPFLLDSFTRGQLGILILFICVAVFQLYTAGKKRLSGFLLALGFTLKFSPIAALFLYFLIKKEWRVFQGLFLGLLVFLILFPSMVLGFGENFHFLREYRHLVWHGAGDFKQESVLWDQLVTPFSHKNQSLYAVLTRLIWPSEEAIQGHSNLWVRLTATGTSAVFFALLSFLCLRKRNSTLRESFLLFSLFPMGMLFISPVAEMHHFTVLFMVFIAGFLYYTEMPAGSVGKFFLDLMIWLSGFGFIGGYTLKELRMTGAPLWTTLALCVFLLLFLLKFKETAREKA